MVNFMVKIHIILILYVALFLFLSNIVVPNSYFKRNVFGEAFCKKAA